MVEICVVYDAEDAFTAFVQFLLAIIALGSLYLKRHNEKPRRKFKTWCLDVSKQGLGAIYAHISNMGIAAVISSYARGEYELEDQCAWYAISFLVDTTLGLFFSLVLLGWLNVEANKRNWTSLMNGGVYEGPDGMMHWGNQVLAWIIILTLVRFVVAFFIWVFSPILARAGDFLFTPLQQNIRFELLFVMIVFPGILNFFYFWVADHYLKAGAEHTDAHEPDSDEEEDISPTNYVATDVNMKAGAPSSPSFELPHVKPGTVRTLV